MNKFWVIVIYTDLHIERLWCSHDDVKEMMSNDKNNVGNIYRSSTDQYAVLVDGDVFWYDIHSRNYEANKAG